MAPIRTSPRAALEAQQPPYPRPAMQAEPQTAALQRRVTALEEENARLLQRTTKMPVRSYENEGRVIRRLVCLTEPVADLITEYDRRVMLVEDNSPNHALDLVDSTEEENRTYKSFKLLLEWCPSVRGLIQSPTDGNMLAITCQQLKKGADGARGDDANSLKGRVAIWLNEQRPAPEPLLNPEDKDDRGFNNDVTGRLLCPVDYNWFDPTVRHAIKHYHSLYPVTAHSWPAFLYRNGQFDNANPSLDLFKGEVLVRAFKCIFMSPTSAKRDPEMENNDPDDQPAGSRRTRNKSRKPRRNVAQLLNMRSVQPQAIAYIAVQLRFALSSVDKWDVRDDVFDYQAFYDNILAWFAFPARAGEVDQLILWWNRIIFGRRRTAPIRPDEIANLSVAISMRLNMA